jgi:gingipain R
MKIFKNFSLIFFLTILIQSNLVGSESKNYKITFETRSHSILVHFELLDFKKNEVSIKGKDYSSLELNSAGNLDQKTFPQLPKVNRDLLLPLAATSAKLELKHLQTKKLKVAPPLPSRGAIMRNEDPDQIPFEEADIYRSQEAFPLEAVRLSDLSHLRDFKVVNLEIRPFRYHFKNQELEVFEKMIIEVKFESASESQNWLHRAMDLSFFKFYQQQFINFPQNEFDARTENLEMTLHPGKMLILSSQRFDGRLDEFVAWKNTRGIQTFVLYLPTTRITWRDVKSYVENFYRNERISHVLLVGDSDLIPFHPGRSGNAFNKEADPLYGLLEGNDYYPEVFVARFAVKTPDELRRVIRKSIDYEKHPTLNGNWYSEALGIASDEGSWSGMIDHERLDLLADMLLRWDYRNFLRIYDPHSKKSSVKEAVENGVGFINYIGHGWEQGWVSSGFANRDVINLNNTEMWPFIVSVACVNGRFDYRFGDSFAEAWLKGAEVEKPTGALAIFASSTNQSWVPPTVGQKKIVELLTSELESTIGGLFFAGSVAVIEDASTTAKQTFETWHIFGDSSVQVRTRAPEAIRVLSVVLNRVSGDDWIFEVETDSSMASVSLATSDSVILRGVTDSRGHFYGRFRSSSLAKRKSATLALTGFNRVPEIFDLSAN